MRSLVGGIAFFIMLLFIVMTVKAFKCKKEVKKLYRCKHCGTALQKREGNCTNCHRTLNLGRAHYNDMIVSVIMAKAIEYSKEYDHVMRFLDKAIGTYLFTVFIAFVVILVVNFM